MFSLKPDTLLIGLLVFFLFVRPTHAFGAGNIASISKVEGQNWRHGDIEDALLRIAMARVAGGKKFDRLMVSRVYFGNWLRDYSQAIDVGTVKSVSAEAIRLLLSVLGFLTFGYGSREFEVTADRLGCYRPEEHIDNPKNYADNMDATQYDRRLRGLVDEYTELAIDPETGMKNYIANNNVGIMTSSKLIHRLFTKCIELGRRYNSTRNDADLYEALRLMGTGLHCLEDFLAHSNYTELALIEMGNHDVFPHVGRDTAISLEGADREVYPVVTGTFGGVDFLHSVAGEVSDKITQNELEGLEGTLQTAQGADTSVLENILEMVPDGIFGDDNKTNKMHEIQNNASAAHLENMQVSPREPEEYTLYIKQVFEQIMPAIIFHDDIIQAITKSIEKIPILPKVLDQLQEQLSMFVFSVIAPFIIPVLRQIKNEMYTGSSEIIESSKRDQHIVFEDDRCSDPTHSMLSKDHFSNILNEVAGRTASQVVHWVVPQLMEAWDDEGRNTDEVIRTIVKGVFHHPAQRNMGDRSARQGREIMFKAVEEWWESLGSNGQREYRRKLSREGVENGQNHKEGVHDTGHGCGQPLKMKKFANTEPETIEDKIAGQIAGSIMSGVTGGFANMVQTNAGVEVPTYDNPNIDTHQGGGDGLGGLFSKFSDALGLGEEGGERRSHTEHSRRHHDDGSTTETTTEYSRQGSRYGQTEYSETQYSSGGYSSERREYQQEDTYGGRTEGYGYETRTEGRPTYGGGYEERTERRYGEGSYEGGSSGGGGYGGGGYSEDRPHHSGGHHHRRDNDDNEPSYGRRDDDNGSGYGREDDEYSGRRHHRRDDDDERREEWRY